MAETCDKLSFLEQEILVRLAEQLTSPRQWGERIDWLQIAPTIPAAQPDEVTEAWSRLQDRELIDSWIARRGQISFQVALTPAGLEVAEQLLGRGLTEALAHVRARDRRGRANASRSPAK